MRTIKHGHYRPPGLHPDAPDVPIGLAIRHRGDYGCGNASCTMCYEPDPKHQATHIINEIAGLARRTTAGSER